ncbi:MAG: prepilin-type N-terminal cleavage/methylation domain-containing protein [Planctomycetes bacterium]|nr:prepilin-type N-terminal cleavage/methylation domain-containing protein [Planctomycetota bacterium]
MKASMMSRQRTEGFSLLEVLIAMFILTIGAASLLSLFAAAASTHRRAVDRTRAALVAEQVLAEARDSYAHGAEPAEVSGALKARLPEDVGGYRWEALLVRPEGDEWTESELFCRVTVRWKESGAERAESFHTVILPRRGAGEQ